MLDSGLLHLFAVSGRAGVLDDGQGVVLRQVLELLTLHQNLDSLVDFVVHLLGEEIWRLWVL